MKENFQHSTAQHLCIMGAQQADYDSSFDSWLSSRLEGLSLDGDVYAGYVRGILEEDDAEDLAQQCVGVVDLLSGSTEDDLTEFTSELQVEWTRRQASKAEAQAAAKLRSDAELEARREREKLELEEAERQRAARASAGQNRSKEDRLERERLLNSYGFVEDVLDEDGNPIEQTEGPTADDLIGGELGQNINKAQVLEIGQRQRAEAKAAHAAKVLKDKQDLEKDRKRKEDAKKRSVKQERRPRS